MFVNGSGIPGCCVMMAEDGSDASGLTIRCGLVSTYVVKHINFQNHGLPPFANTTHDVTQSRPL